MRVVVTGIGTISPLGLGREELVRGLREGRAATPFEPRAFVPPMTLRRLDRSGALALAAGALACRDAGIEAGKEPALGVIVGAGGIGIETTGAFFRGVSESGPAAASPLLFPNTVPNAAAGQIAIALGAGGPNATFAARGVAAEAALACAASLIEMGRAEVLLAGGVAETSEFLVEGYRTYRALSKTGRARPFDRRRDGAVLGEGATFLVLESEARARARGARIYAVLAAAVEGAVETPSVNRYPVDAREYADFLPRVEPERAWIHSCASGARALDRIEAEALAARFSRAPVSSIKGAGGESMAAGALRAAASCLAIAERFIPPTFGLDEPEYGELDLVRGEARDAPTLDTVLQTGLAEGGAAAALIISRL